jgi:PAS domain S-box-containing protein
MSKLLPPYTSRKFQAIPLLDDALTPNEVDVSEDQVDLENTERALLNILDDYSEERNQSENTQRALLNIMEDSAADRNDMENTQRAVLNILDDYSQEKNLAEDMQRAMLNILEDSDADRNSLDNLASIIKFSDDAIISYKLDGTITSWNKGAERVFGYTFDEINGTHVSILSPNELIDEEDTLMKRIRNGEHIDHYETVRVRKDMNEIIVSLTLSAIYDNEGKIVGFSKVLRDISKSKEAEEKLWKYSILESKSKEMEQFTYIASHDLREPLMTIKNYIEILVEDYGGDLAEGSKRYTQSISKAVDRMEALIGGLLDYSRLSKPKQMQDVDCNEIVIEVLQDLNSLIASKNANLIVEQLPLMRAYPLELKLLFQNLINNAIKFQKKDVAPEIHVSSKQIHDGWQFEIKDNGIGIEEKDKEKIFIMFQRLNNKNEYAGTGIGLTHCKKITELHNGNIWVESRPGHSSSFYFTILTDKL